VLIYHGILAPHAAGRAAAVAYGWPSTVDRLHGHTLGATGTGSAVSVPTIGAAAPVSDGLPPNETAPALRGPPVLPLPGPIAPPRSSADPTSRDPAPATSRPPRWRWADLLYRVFAADALACPNCGGRMRVIARRSTIPGSCGASSPTLASSPVRHLAPRLIARPDRQGCGSPIPSCSTRRSPPSSTDPFPADPALHPDRGGDRPNAAVPSGAGPLPSPSLGTRPAKGPITPIQ